VTASRLRTRLRHATVLPILIIAFALILRSGRPGDRGGRAPRLGSQALRHW